MEKTQSYWKADPHQWGPGRTHVIDESGLKTLCGRPLENVPGRKIPAIEYDCRACAQAFIYRQNQERREREYQERQRTWQAGETDRQRAREAAGREWRRWFQAYLDSEAWRVKRNAVLKRASGWCEACGQNRAAQVHHLTYATSATSPCSTCAPLRRMPPTTHRRRPPAARRGPAQKLEERLRARLC